MFLRTNVLFILSATVFVFGETALVDRLKKCSIKDDECMKGLYQSVIRTLATEGAPEFGIKKIDPVELKDISLSILGILNMTLVDGNVEGIGGCEVKKFRNDIEQKTASLHVVCDKIVIYGHYDVDLFGSLLNAPAAVGDNARGKGGAKITMEKVDLRLEYPFHFEKRDDGVHFKLNTAEIRYTFNVLKKATFQTDDLSVGNQEFNKLVIKYLNDNWKIVLETFGNFFLNKAVEIINLYATKMFDNVPVQHFIIDDLTPYV